MTKGDETRQRIVELAAPLFNQRGFAGCSMADIMEATGMEKGGIYRYFPSKEALAAEAFRYAVCESRRLRTDGVDSIPGAVAKLQYILDRFVSEPSAIAGGCPLMNTAVEADDGNEVLRDLARQAFADWRTRIASIIRKGIREGEIAPTCNAAQLADTIIATLEGGLLLSRMDGNKRALKHVRESLDVLLEHHTAAR